MTNVPDEVLGKIARQQNDLFRRVREGSLDPQLVGRGLQDIIEGKLPTLTWNPPIWWRTPEQQLARARQLWPNADLPEPRLASEFTPRTKSEVLLLHVPDTFNSFWDKVVPPTGYTKYRAVIVKSLRFALGKRGFTKPVWLAFDPEHGKNERPDSFWGQADIAASEIFSALLQFPEWPLAWFNGASAPNLSGYRLKCDANWSLVPYLHCWDGDRRLKLDAYWAGSAVGGMSSPSVRKC